MVISFASSQLQKLCNSEKVMQKKLGAPMAEKLQQRLAELQAADNLADISRLPPPRCHELKQDRQGDLAVDLVHPNRLIFRPDHDPIPAKADGGLDWAQVTRIVIVEIADYH